MLLLREGFQLEKDTWLKISMNSNLFLQHFQLQSLHSVVIIIDGAIKNIKNSKTLYITILCPAEHLKKQKRIKDSKGMII